jgi:hypothetical protein
MKCCQSQPFPAIDEVDASGGLFVFGINRIRKKQGAAGITTAAPYIAGQWGRGG